MNIFVTDSDPVQSAKNLCDKHVVKMILESAQLLCTAHWVAWQSRLRAENIKGRALKQYLQDNIPKNMQPAYSMTHFNHPCAVWARKAKPNYDWLSEHALAMCIEYTARYGKRHKTQDIIEWLQVNHPPLFFSFSKTLTPFAVAMPDEYKVEDPVVSYRNYYIGSKSKIAKWRHSDKPSWWPNTYSLSGDADEEEGDDAEESDGI